MERSVAIANEFLRLPNGKGLTQMQLQKLVYFAHGWSLSLTNEPLTSDPVEAWDFGPVYPDLYEHTKFFGKAPIGRLITPDDDELARFFLNEKSDRPAYRASLGERQRAIIKQVWSKYGKLSGARLSALTHQPGTPWFQVYKNGIGKSQEIDNNLIQDHYNEIADRSRNPA
jgi:uncharacterized phage-associated protein